MRGCRIHRVKRGKDELIAPVRVDGDELIHSATANKRDGKRCAAESSYPGQHGIGSIPAQPSEARHRLRSCDDASGVEGSALITFSFATIRFFAVIRQTMKAPLVSCLQKWVKPKNVKVSGFPSPRCFRSRAANCPNSSSRVLSACNSKPNLASRSRKFSKNRSASVPRDTTCKTRGQDGFAVSFPVGLFHPLQHDCITMSAPRPE
jgi:hypothetical protein